MSFVFQLSVFFFNMNFATTSTQAFKNRGGTKAIDQLSVLYCPAQAGHLTKQIHLNISFHSIEFFQQNLLLHRIGDRNDHLCF